MYLMIVSYKNLTKMIMHKIYSFIPFLETEIMACKFIKRREGWILILLHLLKITHLKFKKCQKQLWKINLQVNEGQQFSVRYIFCYHNSSCSKFSFKHRKITFCQYFFSYHHIIAFRICFSG